MRRTLIATSSVLLLFVWSVPNRLGARGFRSLAITPGRAGKSSSTTAYDAGPQAANAALGEVILKLRSAALLSQAAGNDAPQNVFGLISRVFGENRREGKQALF